MIAPCKGLQGDAAQSAANQARNTGAKMITFLHKMTNVSNSYRLMKFLHRVINNLILPYTDVCIALYTQCFLSVCGKNFTG